MRTFWAKIICAKESRLDFTTAVERFKGELTSLFSTFRYGDAGQLAFFPAEMRTPIMEAGRTQTLLRVTYAGVERLVEPYSLEFKWRKGGVGQEYLYVWDRTGGNSGPGIKTLFNWKIRNLATTDIKFEPRAEIALAKAGEYAARTTFASTKSRMGRSIRPRTRREPRYRVQCAHCQRVFDRTTTSVVMRPHQDSFGNRCPGRRGYRV